jgi:CHAD domain-containing protein
MKKKASSKPFPRDESVCTFGARVLQKHLKALAGEMEGVGAGHPDIEFIHRARVATRRLRAALPLFADCFSKKQTKEWTRAIRQVTRSLGRARDRDVQIDLLENVRNRLPDAQYAPGVERLLLRVRQEREALQPEVEQAVQHFQASGTVDSIDAALKAYFELAEQNLPPTRALYERSAAAVLGNLDALLAYDADIRIPEKIEELHAARIAAKRLRYTMETFSPLYPERLKSELQHARTVQDYLGEIHDCDIWQEALPAFVHNERRRSFAFYGDDEPFLAVLPGLLFFEHDRKDTRATTYRAFLKCWEAAEVEGIWAKLRSAAALPLRLARPAFPPRQPLP